MQMLLSLLDSLGWAYLLGGVGLICNKQVQISIGLDGSVHIWCKVSLVLILKYKANCSAGELLVLYWQHTSAIQDTKGVKEARHLAGLHACYLLSGVLYYQTTRAQAQRSILRQSWTKVLATKPMPCVATIPACLV